MPVPRSSRRFAAFCLTFVVMGCGGGGGDAGDQDAGDDASVSDASEHDGALTLDAGEDASALDGGADTSVPSGPHIVASAPTRAFGEVVASGTVTLDVIFRNDGDTASGSLTATLEGAGAFAITLDECSGAPLLPSDECTVRVSVHDAVLGARSGTVRVSSLSGDTAETSLTATIVLPYLLELDDASHDFGATTVHESAQKTFRVTNTGGQTSPAITSMLTGHAAYSLGANGCAAPLAPLAYCEIEVVYAPTAPGTTSASLAIDFGAEPLTVSLMGQAVIAAALHIEASSETFTPTLLGGVSSDVKFTVTNQGTVPTGALTTMITGSDASQFVVHSSTCTAGPLDGGDACEVVLRFAPTGERGGRAASLAVTASPGGTGTHALMGTALAPAMLVGTGGTFTYEIEGVGGTSAAHPFLVTNVGDVQSGPLTVALSGANADQFALSGAGCSTPLPAESSCDASVVFKPTRFGVANATVTISSASGGSVTYGVSGTGRDYLALIVDLPINGGGTGSVSGAGITCPTGPCSVSVPRTDASPIVVALTATPAASSTFAGWSGECAAAGTLSTCMLTLGEAATHVGVGFDLKTYDVTVQPMSIAGRKGRVVARDTSLDCGVSCTISVTHGTEITLRAEPEAGAYFGGFGGACIADGRACTFSVTSDASVTASFTPANRTFTTQNAYTVLEVKAFATDTSTEATKMLSGADALCRSLGGSNDFHAFLGGVGVNAITRIPGTPRGFVRADGRPFKTRLTPSSPTFYPPNLDQTGTPVSSVTTAAIWTGVDASGEGSNLRSCGNWTSGQVNTGNMESTVAGWVAYGSGSCIPTTRAHVLCLESLYRADVTPDAPPETARLVFVTNGLFDPTSGVGGADALCEAEAEDVLPGTYRAMLATADDSMASRFVTTSAPIYRPDGTYLSPNITAFLTYNTFPLSSISTDARNREVDALVALGSGNPQMKSTTMTSCFTAANGSWSTTNENAHLGSSSNRAQWMTAAYFPCTWPVHVHCMQE